MKFTTATWNVNSIKVRLEQLQQYLVATSIDVIALQETKTVDDNFPQDSLQDIGYHAAYFGEKQYNGVAILAKQPIQEVQYGLLDQEDEQRRFLAATIEGVRYINVYVPNGESLESDKYIYKLAWLEQLHKAVQEAQAQYQHVILMGDFNIAPGDMDVYDANVWQDRVLVSPPERDAFQKLLDAGLCDLFRLKNPDVQSFSWWNYRNFAYRRNQGLRIDHILVTSDLAKWCNNCFIDEEPRKQDRPSDHTIVGAAFAR